MLFVVTNRKLVPEGEFLKKIDQIAKAEPYALILREKDLQYKELYKLAKQVKCIIDGHNTKLIISQSLEIAKEVGASGVHMSYEQFVKEKPNFNGITGVSIHSTEEAVKAEALGASYILAGHIYGTDCKKGLKPRGISFLKEVKSLTKIPLIGIGGIDEYNMDEIFSCNAHGIAMMSSIMKSNNCNEKILNVKNTMLKYDGIKTNI